MSLALSLAISSDPSLLPFLDHGSHDFSFSGTLEEMQDLAFFQQLRLSKIAFNYLCSFLPQKEDVIHMRGKKKISIYMCLQINLFFYQLGYILLYYTYVLLVNKLTVFNNNFFYFCFTCLWGASIRRKFIIIFFKTNEATLRQQLESYTDVNDNE